MRDSENQTPGSVGSPPGRQGLAEILPGVASAPSQLLAPPKQASQPVGGGGQSGQGETIPAVPPLKRWEGISVGAGQTPPCQRLP